MKRHTLLDALTSLMALLCLCVAVNSRAESFPDRALTMIVPWSAGGPVDAAARIVAAGVAQRLGQSTVVDNKPGASGILGSEAAARSKPDGYTVFVGNVDTHALNSALRPKLSYDPVRSFEPVAYLGRLPLVLVMRSEFGGSTGADLIRIAKQSPGKLTYGSWGVGSLGHLAGVMAEQAAKIEMLHVPFQGGAPAQVQLLGNQIDLLVTQVPYAEQMQRAGKLKILGLTSAQRSPLFPNVPTMDEQGFKGFAADQWVAFFVPSNTPQSARDKLTEAINATVKSPETAAKLRDVGFEPSGGSPAEVAKLVERDGARWSQLVKERGIRID